MVISVYIICTYITPILCTSVTGWYALCLTKHKKKHENYTISVAFYFWWFWYENNFKLISYKEQNLRGDHSDSNNFFLFIFKFQEINWF